VGVDTGAAQTDAPVRGSVLQQPFLPQARAAVHPVARTDPTVTLQYYLHPGLGTELDDHLHQELGTGFARVFLDRHRLYCERVCAGEHLGGGLREQSIDYR